MHRFPVHRRGRCCDARIQLLRGYTLMQIPAGLLVDRYGVSAVLFSMAVSSLGSAAFALAPNLLDVFAAALSWPAATR